MDAAMNGGVGGAGAADAAVSAWTDAATQADSEPAADAGSDSGQIIECDFNADCELEDDNLCTTNKCVAHKCVTTTEENDGHVCTDTAILDPILQGQGQCHAGICCAGCMDSVLGCMRDNPKSNEAACGTRGIDCRVCQPDGESPSCVAGKCCPSDDPC
jgi:hypothetical protein